MVCHDMMKDAHSVGGVTDAEMREFEADCLVQEPETAIQQNWIMLQRELALRP